MVAGLSKGDFMKIFENKKGFVQHPIWLFVAGLVIGLVLVYLWINYIDIANPYCPKVIR
jgi:hypothetical protein